MFRVDVLVLFECPKPGEGRGVLKHGFGGAS